MLYTGLDDQLGSISQKLAGSDMLLKEAPPTPAAEVLEEAGLFIVGPQVTDPVRLVQVITAEDKYLSIIVMATPAQINKVKQSIQFAPFVGKNTNCIALSEGLDLVSTFRNACMRTMQRRSFSRINKAPGTAASIASSTVKVDNLGIFLEQAPIGALLVDKSESIVAMNRKARILFGATEEKGYAWRDLIPGLSLQQLQMGIHQSVGNENKVVQIQKLFFELYLSEVNDQEGRTLYILLVNDITEQKLREEALKESEALFRFMAEAMPQKLWTADKEGNLDYFNQHWTSYTGLSLRELKGWGWLQSIHPEDAAANREAWQRAIDTGEDFGFEQRIRNTAGQYRWHLVRGVARKDAQGKVLMWVGTNTDVHEQKAFSDELALRVRDRTYELEKSNSELEQFVYITSHDLQEPLRKIRMFSEMLRTSYGPADDQSARYMDKISNTAQRMTTLLKALLNFTQMNREEQFEPTDLNDIVAKAMVDLELVTAQKQAIIEADDLPVVQAIPVQMHQLFYNLLSNALKYAKEDVPPNIRISAAIADAATVQQHTGLQQHTLYYEIKVQDNGIGFEQHYAEQIFHVFQRLHGREEYSGTGIGLALCKKVVTNHYGAIWATAAKGNGSCFHVLLPATSGTSPINSNL